MLIVNSKVVDGVTYYSFESRKVAYSLAKSKVYDSWELWSNRLAYNGGINIRFFDSLEEIEKKIKSLKGLSLLLS